jgi:hypothetical protein
MIHEAHMIFLWEMGDSSKPRQVVVITCTEHEDQSVFKISYGNINGARLVANNNLLLFFVSIRHPHIDVHNVSCKLGRRCQETGYLRTTSSWGQTKIHVKHLSTTWRHQGHAFHIEKWNSVDSDQSQRTRLCVIMYTFWSTVPTLGFYKWLRLPSVALKRRKPISILYSWMNSAKQDQTGIIRSVFVGVW